VPPHARSGSESENLTIGVSGRKVTEALPILYSRFRKARKMY